MSLSNSFRTRLMMAMKNAVKSRKKPTRRVSRKLHTPKTKVHKRSLNAFMLAKERARKGDKNSFVYKGVKYVKSLASNGHLIVYKRSSIKRKPSKKASRKPTKMDDKKRKPSKKASRKPSKKASRKPSKKADKKRKPEKKASRKPSKKDDKKRKPSKKADRKPSKKADKKRKPEKKADKKRKPEKKADKK